MKKKSFSYIEICSLIVAGALLLCLADLPYAFYTLIRFAVSAVGIAWAVKWFKGGNNDLGWTAIAIVALFQPFIRIPFGRFLWNVLDVAVATALLILVFYTTKKR